MAADEDRVEFTHKLDVSVPLDLVTVTAPRETWMGVVYAVYAAYWEGQADPEEALPILTALGIEANAAGSDLLPVEVAEWEKQRIARIQAERERGRKR